MARLRPFAPLLVVLVAAGPLLAATELPPGGDQLIVLTQEGLLTVTLPSGPVEGPPVPLAEPVTVLEVLSDGRLVTARRVPQSADSWHLAEIQADGSLADIGFLAPGIVDLVDLAAGPDGAIYGLFAGPEPPPISTHLFRFPPGTAPTTVELAATGITSIALAPHGLWGLTGDRLQAIFPDTGTVIDAGRVDLGQVWAASTDSTGAIWASVDVPVTPPPPVVFRFDPATGSIGGRVSSLLDSVPFALAVRRRCVETDTARCLQGGRFRAEVDWQDFAGGAGPGRVTPARSADSALFHFFEPANWELQVKVLDGCPVDGHFWVFASAATTVAFELRVTDLDTGFVRSYQNPLGEPASAITDTGAFPCR